MNDSNFNPELQLRAIADHLPVLIAYVDARERYGYANATYEHWYRISLADIVGRSVRDVLGAQRYALIEPYVRRALAGERVSYELKFPHPDGCTRDVRVQYVPDFDQGAVRGFYALIEDITDLVRGDEQRRMLEAAIATSINAVAMADMDGHLTYVNAAFVQLWRCADAETVLGRHVSAFWRNPDEAAAVVRALAQRGRWEGEMSARRCDGDIAPIRLAAHLVRDDTGKPLAMMASFLDVSEQRDAEQALRASHQILEGTFDATPLLIAYLDPAFNFVRVNRAYAAADGKTPEYFRGKNHFALFPDASNEAIFRGVRDSGIPHSVSAKPFAYEHSPERGVTHWDWTLTPIKDAAGAVTALVFALHNVTDRVRAIEAAGRSEALLKQAQHIAKLGSWELDLQTKRLYWSDEVYRIFETGPAQFGGTYQAFLDFVHPEDRERVNQAYIESVEKRVAYDIMHRIRMADGRIKHVHERCETIYDAGGQPRRTVGSVQDITASKRAEQALVRAYGENRAVTQAVQDVLYMVDAAGRLVWWNRRVEQVTGLTPAQLRERPAVEFFHAEDRAGVAEILGRAFTTGHAEIEARMLTADGPVVYHYNGVTVSDDRGQVIGVAGVGRDVSERIRVEERLREAQRIARVGSWELDLAANVLIWSDEIFRIFEIDQTRFGASYEAFLDAIHPEDRDKVNEAYTGSLHSRAPYGITHRLLMPDGRIKWVREQCESFFDADGKPLRSVGTVQDITESHLTQLKLRETTQLLDSIVENIPSMIFMKDARDLRFALFNKAGEDLVGLRSEDLLGKNDYDFFPREQAEFFTAKDRAVLEHDGVLDIPEEPIDTPHNGRRVLHTRKIALRDEQGVARYLLGISEDITERRQAEEALNNFKTTLDQTLDCVFMFDPETLRFFYANQGAINQIGYSYDELLRMTPVDIKPEFDEVRFRALLAPLLEGVESQLRFRTFHRSKTGADVPVEIALQYVHPPEQCGRFVAVVRDITERVRAENELRRANESLEQRVAERTRELDTERGFIATVLHTAGALVVVMNAQGHIVRFNRACENLTGYRFDELRDQPIWDYVIPPEQRAGVQQVFRNLTATAMPSVYENEWLARDGGRRLIAWSNSTITNEQGDVAYVIGTGIDITARKKAEAALVAAKEEAERANAAKSEFLARMSHELRTPMNAILGFGQLLDVYADPPLPPTEAENVKEILRAGNHLLELINEVLDLSRIEAGRMVVNVENVAVDSLILDAVTLLQPQADAKPVTLINESAAAGAVFARGDATRVKQVLLNLLSNAVKYNRPEGSVRVRWERITSGHMRIAVTDTGAGLTPEQIAHLFVPFERLEADKKAIEGAGIGLALSKRLVEMMRGTIGVDSTPGRGSTFWFTLPLAERDPDILS